MRICSLVMAGTALAVLVSTPVQAGKITFSPQAFQVIGGMNSPQKKKQLFSFGQDGNDALTHQTVAFDGPYQPGTIVVRTEERKLYYVLPGGEAILYHVGVGREGFEWSGTNKVSRKAEWPDWRPPQEMIDREADKGHFIPAYLPGGLDNPLGARAIYIGNTQYRIHGTTQPWSIGQAMSSGCIRMMNDEVIDLYARVKVGDTVVVE